MIFLYFKYCIFIMCLLNFELKFQFFFILFFTLHLNLHLYFLYFKFIIIPNH